MPRFGDYETVQELHRTALGCVFIARRAGGGEPVFAIKACLPDVDVVGVESAQQAVRAFLDSAALQKRLAGEAGASGRSHWAAVHAAGAVEGGAYYATDLARRGSCERLVSGPAAVDARALTNIFRSVAAALVAIKAATGGGHGNLRASNVLLMDDRPPAECLIALCDPVATASQERAERTLRDDLHALGRLIYALVMKREHGGGWPVAESPAWSVLGPTGPGWRDLVNRLLDPAVLGGTSKLDVAGLDVLLPGAAATTGAAASGGRGNKKLLIAAAAAGILLSGSGVYLLLGRGGGPPDDPTARSFEKWAADPAAKTRWEQACTEYYNWASVFTRADAAPGAGSSRARAFKTRQEMYDALAPRELAVALAPFHQKRVESPDVIAGKSGGAFLTLRAEPPQLATSDAGVRKTGELLEELTRLRAVLKDELPKASGLAAAAAEFERRGWTDAATYAKDLLARHREATGGETWTGTVPTVVDEIVLATPILAEVQASIRKLEDDAKKVVATGDPYLARLPAAVDQLVSSAAGGADSAGGAASLGRLSAQLKQVVGQVDEVTTFVEQTWPLIERESLEASDEHKRLVAATGLDASGMRAFLAEAKNHPSLPAAENPVPKVAELVEQLKTKAAEHDAVAKRRPLDSETVGKIRGLESRLGDLKKLTWVRKNREKVEADSGALSAEAKTLTAEIERKRSEYVAAGAKARSELVATLRKRESVTASAAVNAVWVEQRDRLIASMESADAEDIDAAAKRLADGLKDVDALFAAAPKAGERDPAWAQALARAADTARERFVRKGLEAAGPGSDASAMVEASRAAASEYSAWGTSAQSIRREGDAIDQRLREGALLADAGPDGKSVADVWSGLLAQEATRDQAVTDALRPLRERIERLQEIGAERSVPALLERIEKAGPGPEGFEQAWPAWNRLVSADLGWPSNAQQLSGAPGVAEKLVKLLGDMNELPAARRSELVGRFRKGMAARWNAYVGSLRSGPEGVAALKQALAIAPRMGVSEAEVTDPKLKYNIALAALMAVIEGGGGGVGASGGGSSATDDDAKKAIEAFLAQVRALPTEVSGHPTVSQSVSKLGPLVAPKPAEPPPPDPTTFGPATKGWKGTALERGAVLEFTQGGSTLRFVRIEFSREGFGPDTVYIGDREVSVAMFNTVAGSVRGGWNGLASAMGFDPEDDGWIGPRAWSWKGSGPFTENTHWIAAAPAFQSSKPYYAPGLRVEGAPGGRTLNDKTGGKPALAMPMQQLSAVAAMLAAEASGCRLPTAEEWKAAARQVAGAGKETWNLRDATFAKQQDYILGDVRQSLGAAATQYPAPDDGSFAAKERGACYPFDDGVLWFRPVDGDTQPLHNLVGNVAEFVYAGAGLPPVGEPGAAVGIIGASALSVADQDAESVTPVARAEMRSGYSDVGFRLAFSATGSKPKPPPLAAQALAAIGPEPYLLR